MYLGRHLGHEVGQARLDVGICGVGGALEIDIHSVEVPEADGTDRACDHRLCLRGHRHDVVHGCRAVSFDDEHHATAGLVSLVDHVDHVLAVEAGPAGTRRVKGPVPVDRYAEVGHGAHQAVVPARVL